MYVLNLAEHAVLCRRRDTAPSNATFWPPFARAIRLLPVYTSHTHTPHIANCSQRRRYHTARYAESHTIWPATVRGIRPGQALLLGGLEAVLELVERQCVGGRQDERRTTRLANDSCPRACVWRAGV